MRTKHLDLSPNRPLSRRQVLRGTGVLLGLPLLDAMAAAERGAPRTARFVAICAGLGFHAPYLFPDQPGPNNARTPYLELLADHRERFTLISGLSHPEQNGNNGHASSMTWLTSARRPGLAGFKNTVSLDQIMVDHLGGATRFPYLCLSNDGGSLSWTPNGINIPAQSSPARLFKQLFIEGSPDEVEQQIRDLRRGGSILDAVRTEANKLKRKIDNRDSQKLEEYFAAIRDLETRMKQSASWIRRPKPQVDYDAPQDVSDRNDILAKQKLMYDMMALAFRTDSTRVITLSLGNMNSVPSNIPGVNTDWHNLSHHGKDEAKIKELRLIEEAEFVEFNRFLTQLHQIREGNRSLLDNSVVLFGSNLGNASSHDWHNLPIIVAGGDYKHGAYVAHDPKNNTPLANLFVEQAQRLGVEIDSFGSSTAVGIRGLHT